MTVKETTTVEGKELVECQWFDKDIQLQKAEFPPDMLIEVIDLSKAC